MLDFAVIAAVGLCVGLLVYLASTHVVETATAARQGARGEKAVFSAFVGNRVFAHAALVVVAVAVAWFLSHRLLLCVGLAVAGVVLPRKYMAWRRAKRQTLVDSQIPDVLSMMSGSMRAGFSLMKALDSVAKDGPDPIRQEIDLCLREVRMGIDLDAALDHMARRVGGSEMVMVAAAIKIARDSGGNLAESLDNLAKSVRDRQNMEKKVLALTAQGRMQALVMAGLPFFMLYMLHQLDAAAMAPMFSTVLGWGVFTVVCIWVWIGFRVIKKIMSIDI